MLLFTFKAYQKPQEALNLLVTDEHYWTFFYMQLYMFFTQFAECNGTDCKYNGIMLPGDLDSPVPLH
jgi:hypothetical protein